MKKRWLVFLGVLSTFSLLLALFINHPMVSGSNGIPQQKISLEINENQMHEIFLINLLEETAINVSLAHEYKIDLYDCTQFSHELVKRLERQGIIAYCVSGIYKGKGYSLHAWVIVEAGNMEIPIEATGGYIIDDEDYQEYYKIRAKGYCI